MVSTVLVVTLAGWLGRGGAGGAQGLVRRAAAPVLQSAPPDLPADSLVLQEANSDVWLDETLEYSGLRDDPQTPHALRGYLCSFKLSNGVGCHAFKGGGVSFSRYISQGGIGWESAKRFADAERLRLVIDLLDAVNHLHCRGCAHLDLTADSLVVRPTADG